MYCACRATSSRGHGGANPRRSSFRRLCVLRLPRNKRTRPRGRQSAPQLLQEALCTAPAAQQVAAATAAPTRAAAPSEALCNKQPRPRRRQSAPAPSGGSVNTAPATQQVAAATAVYCACHATSGRGHGGANPRRSSFRRLCVLRLPRNKRTRPRRRQSAPQLLQEALCTVPAKQHVCEMSCV